MRYVVIEVPRPVEWPELRALKTLCDRIGNLVAIVVHKP